MKRTANTLMGLTMVGLATAGCTGGGNTPPQPERIVSSSPSSEAPVTPVTPSSTAPSSETPGNDTQAAELNSRIAKAQAGFATVSAEKFQQFVQIVGTHGYIDQDLDVKDVMRLVVPGPNGVVYTDDVEYTNPVGTPGDNPPKAVEVYIRRPGEAHAQHVIEDGQQLGGDPRIPTPLDGKADDVYYVMSENQVNTMQQQYGQLFFNALAAAHLEHGGQSAQQDYVDAINVTDSRY